MKFHRCACRREFLISAGVLVGNMFFDPHTSALTLSRKKKTANQNFQIVIADRERCPVCGMFVKPYPKWITQIRLKNGSHLSFDGMKCLYRYYLNPGTYSRDIHRNDFKRILVRDYYTLRSIDYLQAFYVIGSDIIGPMGHELIPFADEKNAGIFKVDHHGLRILKFKDITIALLDLLDKSRKTVILKD